MRVESQSICVAIAQSNDWKLFVVRPTTSSVQGGSRKISFHRKVSRFRSGMTTCRFLHTLGMHRQFGGGSRFACSIIHVREWDKFGTVFYRVALLQQRPRERTHDDTKRHDTIEEPPSWFSILCSKSTLLGFLAFPLVHQTQTTATQHMWIYWQKPSTQ